MTDLMGTSVHGMAPKIKVMPESLANKIAAGEVVERPASIVKELVENSLDAGATKVKVDVTAGGKKRIIVSDDGEGMSFDDALMAFERHATSKIRSPEDLLAIKTYGFRGEALPSIASVSKVVLTTRVPGEDEGTRVVLSGGRLVKAERVGCPSGTEVVVKDLFFNLPARLKFLKGPKVESDYVTEAAIHFIFATDGVGFSLSSAGRVVLNVPRGVGCLEKVRAVFGSDVADAMRGVQADGDGCRVRGYISGPEVVRSSSKSIMIFVNGRPVRDRIVNHAIMEAYRASGPRKGRPLCILYLDMPPHLVDVNVHPTKAEIRFQRPNEVHDLVYRACVESLHGHGRQHFAFTQKEGRGETPKVLRVAGSRPLPEEIDSVFGGRESKNDSVLRLTGSGRERIPLHEMVILGQLANTYIIVDGGDDLLIVDQHAAHERILFNKLKEEFQKGGPRIQKFLLPQVIDLSGGLQESLCNKRDDLARLGIEIEAFGGSAAVVRSAPAVISGADFASLLSDVAEELDRYTENRAIEEAFDAVISVMACHGAIRAGKRLDLDEMRELLKELDDADSGDSCPHGRPTMIKISKEELEKRFGRR